MKVASTLFQKKLVIRMDNIRFVLILALGIILVLLWEAWQVDYGPKPEITEVENFIDTGEDIPGTFVENKKIEVVESESTEASGTVPVIEAYASQIINVKTDVIQLEIDTKGGTLRNLDLLDYPEQKVNHYVNSLRSMVGLPKEVKDLAPVRLFNSSEEKLFLAQSGLISASGSVSAPNHHSVLIAEQDSYQLSPDQNILRVPLTWSDEEGLTVTKTYIFERGSYVITLEQKVSNDSGSAWSGRQYAQLLRRPFTAESKNTFIRTYTGGVVYTEEEKYEKIDYDDMEDENLSVNTPGGWSAMIQHYFASSWIPPSKEENHFYTKSLSDERYVIGSYSPNVEVQPNSDLVLSSRIFSGPKIQPMMEKVATGLELTVDYSWLTFIAKPIYWLLNKINTLVDNWGLAIIGVTLVIKALFFKLSEASYKSMAKMRKIQPKLKQLKERYADDKQRFNTEMMAMYKKEKVNPMGGCLPIMVQIPVFISLYWVLVETVELRQVPFLWLSDLSVMDPFFVLPVLMGITMKLQQSLNPPPLDPVQAKVMKMFPYIFTVFFLFFPSGLVLYWVVNNTLSFFQQWYITRKIEAAA